VTTLHLGVIDIPYAYSQEVPGKGRKKKKQVVKAITTGEVADILEENYSLMETFYETHEEEIVGHLEKSLAGALESMMQGSPSSDPFAAGTQQINEMFKQFILTGEAETVAIPGTPTKAALKGVSHRRAHPYAKANPRRPSFYDTGMYVDNFMSWID
jgi:hypothetical protein